MLQILSVIERLAAVCGLSSVDALYARHLRACLRLICESSFLALPDSHYVAPLPNYYDFVGPSANLEAKEAEAPVVADHGVSGERSAWTAQSPQRLLFSTLCRRGVRCIDEQLDAVLPVLAACAHPDADKTLRVSAIALAEFAVRTSAEAAEERGGAAALAASNQRWAAWVELVVRDVVVPSIVWRAGRAATAIRLQGFLTVNAMFARGLLTPRLLEHDTLLPSVLPVLTSSLDDFDPRIRLQASRALRALLSTTDARLHEDVVTGLYRELLKRLDDSTDDIRVDACHTLCAFVRVVPAEYDRTHYKYLLRGLLVHLDDTSARIQEAVFAVLSALRHFDAPVFFTEVHAVRDKHSSPAYCDRLMAMAPK